MPAAKCDARMNSCGFARLLCRGVVLLALLLAGQHSVPAQAPAWPTRTITLIVGFDVGGVTDILARFGGSYVVTCGTRTEPGMNEAERSASLRGRLAAGAIPDWLRLLPAEPGDAFTVYRVRMN